MSNQDSNPLRGKYELDDLNHTESFAKGVCSGDTSV